MLASMEVHLTHEQEARLAKLATDAGVEPESLVQNAVSRLLGAELSLGGSSPTPLGKRDLPLWHLGGAGPLHRRDIYDDAP